MRIAMVAPAFGGTGGPEIMVRNITDGLMKLGVAVTLFAPADWPDQGVPLIPTLPQSLWNMPEFLNQSKRVRRNFHMASQTKVLSHQENFDLIHLHVPSFAYAVSAVAKIPTILSSHNRLQYDEFNQLKASASGLTLVAMSKSQSDGLPYDAVIWNGLRLEEIQPEYKHGSYLLSVGRLTDQKGIHKSIEIARLAQKKLVIIGRVGHAQERQSYFSEQILPHIDGKNVIHIEKVEHSEIYGYMHGASHLLFPIIRPESFGLVVAEALACGTPILGSTAAPLPEILGGARSHDVAFLSENMEDLAKAARHPEKFDRRACRKYAEKNFDIMITAKKYFELYQKILKK